MLNRTKTEEGQGRDRGRALHPAQPGALPSGPAAAQRRALHARAGTYRISRLDFVKMHITLRVRACGCARFASVRRDRRTHGPPTPTPPLPKKKVSSPHPIPTNPQKNKHKTTDTQMERNPLGDEPGPNHSPQYPPTTTPTRTPPTHKKEHPQTVPSDFYFFSFSPP